MTECKISENDVRHGYFQDEKLPLKYSMQTFSCGGIFQVAVI